MAIKVPFTCFPMTEIGEERTFCTKFIIGKAGTGQVLLGLVEEWLIEAASLIFGPGLEYKEKNLRSLNRLYINEPITAVLKLIWVSKIAGETMRGVCLDVRGSALERPEPTDRPIVRGRPIILVPP